MKAKKKHRHLEPSSKRSRQNKQRILKKKSIRDKFRQSRKQFESRKQNEMSSLLAAGVAHEFNNILGAVDGHAEWALSTGDLADLKEAMTIIRQACARSSQVTRALQQFAQPFEEEESKFLLMDRVNEVLDHLKPQIAKANVEIVVSEDLKNLMVYGVAIRVEEILRNLIKNSVEAFMAPYSTNNSSKSTTNAAKKSEEKFKVSLSLEKQSKSSRFHNIMVSDNGPGIPEVFRAMIFQPFFTTKGVLKVVAQKSDSESVTAPLQGFAGGTGLGLYRSKVIAAEMGGDLKLVHSSDRGTVWCLSLQK